MPEKNEITKNKKSWINVSFWFKTLIPEMPTIRDHENGHNKTNAAYFWIYKQQEKMKLFPNFLRILSLVDKTYMKFLSQDITQQTFVLMKTSRARRTYLPYSYVFRRRLQDVFKTSWSRPIYSSWSYVFKTSSRRF